MSERVVFYVNGLPRLLTSLVLAREHYGECEKHVILLRQYGYRYEPLLDEAREVFDGVHDLHMGLKRYSHSDQFLSTYLRPFFPLRRQIRPGTDLVLFGLRSPAQKFLVRRTRAFGGRVHVYAESLATDRYFVRESDTQTWRRIARRFMHRAFEYQHDYEHFFLPCKEIYSDSPHFSKLAEYPAISNSPAFARYVAQLTEGFGLEGLPPFECVFLGQPLSGMDKVLTVPEEQDLLRSILGDRPVLVLPHPNERPDEDKYACLPRAHVLRASLPSELIMHALKPRETHTYSSTAGLAHALAQPDSINHFHPVSTARYALLKRYGTHVSNVVLHDEHIHATESSSLS